MMTTSEKTDAWRKLFSSLKIDVESSSPPTSLAKGADAPADDRPWFQTITRFTRRGFLRVLVTPGDGQMGVHTQYAVPGADADYAQTLKAYLNGLSDVAWSSDTTESPWTLYAEGIPSAKAEAIVEAFMRLADHITAAEDGARARVLADEFGAGATKAGDTQISLLKTSNTKPQITLLKISEPGAPRRSPSREALPRIVRD